VDDLAERAARIFPGAKVLHRENKAESKARLFDWVQSLKPHLQAVERWSLACEGLDRAARIGQEPHRTWAAELLADDMAKMLKALHDVNRATEYPSTDPATWPKDRPLYCSSLSREEKALFDRQQGFERTSQSSQTSLSSHEEFSDLSAF
jgi:hypothetical protein